MRIRTAYLALVAVALSCSNKPTSPPPPPPPLVSEDCTRCLEVESVFESSPAFEGCAFASPLLYEGDDEPQVIAVGGGHVVALDPGSGAELWRVELPTGEEELATIVATPAIVGSLLVAEYHTTQVGGSRREAHFVVVVDLEAHALAPEFERLEIEGTFDGNDGETVPFRSQNALGRAQIAHAIGPGSTLGLVYVTYGNARDIQPWHGFAFEIDLDAWRADGPDAAVTGSLITTPEADCGEPGVSGSRSRICGGGLWSPSGTLVVERGDSFELIFAPGNGQLDLKRDDFANTLMKVGPGLDFDPACDAVLCADFDPDAPSTACVSSCRNLFVPRDDVGDPFPVPETGACDGLGMFECWAKLDYVGGSTPAHLVLDSGTEVLAYPTKDGSVYLDAEHLGTLYDREQLVEICGTADDRCRWNWAGMIVTQPAVATVTDRPTILVPTFMPDETHPAGVVALAIDESSGTPKFERLWSVPDFDDDAAIERFREHPTRITLQRVSDELEIAWIGEALRKGTSKLIGIDVETGDVLAEVDTAGAGMRFTQPLVASDMLYLNHCVSDDDGTIEGFEIRFED